MPRKPKKQIQRIDSELSEGFRLYLETGDPGSMGIDYFMKSNDDFRTAWEQYRAEILTGWIRQQPCTRPDAWWKFDAPRWDRKFDAWFDGALPEPRRRIGGNGTPQFEKWAVKPRFKSGIPVDWMDDIDPADPPTFESEAAYLQRHGVLTQTEKKHLTKHPELLEPEKIEMEE